MFMVSDSALQSTQGKEKAKEQMSSETASASEPVCDYLDNKYVATRKHFRMHSRTLRECSIAADLG